MRIRKSTPIVGALIRPGGRSAGNWSRNGCGTCVSNWGISCTLILYVPPSLRPPSSLPHPPHLFRHTRLPPRAMFPPHVGLPWKAGRFSGQDFALQPDGTLRCPADQKLLPHEHRREADGSLRAVYGASIRSCRLCPLRQQCQWHGAATAKPRQVSVLLHPLSVGREPLLWRDWSRRVHRHACIQLLRHQRVEVQREPGITANRDSPSSPLSRASRAHSWLSWAERLARNARSRAAGQVSIQLFGVPASFATSLGLAMASHSNLLEEPKGVRY